MSLGLQEAARRTRHRFAIALAADLDARALKVYGSNFPDAMILNNDVSALLPGVPGTPLGQEERTLKETTGTIDILVGGPPCQGHSDLNNHTRRNDPKNSLYLRLARATEVFSPKVAIVENS